METIGKNQTVLATARLQRSTGERAPQNFLIRIRTVFDPFKEPS